VHRSKNSNADLHILNDPEIPSMIQTIEQVKKVMLRIKEHAASCSCCRDVMNDDQFQIVSKTLEVKSGRVRPSNDEKEG
jgi:hypothetical protein